MTVWFIPLIFALSKIYMYILSTNAPPLSEDAEKYDFDLTKMFQ